MRIAHFGTFDVENYGDLLFPLILERRLSDICEEIVHVSPAGGPPVWRDCVPTVGFDEFLEDPGRIDGVIIGGGQIVRTAPTSLEVYDRGGVSAFTTYPSIWLGAAYVAAQHDVPLCWNVPGVSTDFGPVAAQLVRWTASVTDYLAVRDEAGRRSLEKAGVSQDMNVAPDSAAEVSELWGEEEISAAYRQVFARHDRPVPEHTLTFHVNSRWAGEEAAAVAARIDRICKGAGAVPILLGIGPCHGDDEVQRRVSREMSTGPLVVDRPQSLLEVTACIARSDAYFGSSLHGMIAACSFGTRGVLVASSEDNKYAGFLDHLGLSYRLVESWSEAEQLAEDLFSTSRAPCKLTLDTIRPTLDEHWNRIRETLTGYREHQPQNDKQAAVEQLRLIGEDRFSNLQFFRPLLTEQLEESHIKLQALRRDLEEESAKLQQERRKLREESRGLREERQELRKERQRLKEERQRTKEVRHELNIANRDVLQLTRWLETLDNGISALLQSRQWKIGNTAGELYRRATRKSAETTVDEHLEEVLQKFRAWRGGGRNQ